MSATDGQSRHALIGGLVAAVSLVAPAGAGADKMFSAAGIGRDGFSGDGGPATSARVSFPADVAATANGGFLIADEMNHRVRRVSPAGTISTVAGSGDEGFSGDGGAATSAQLSSPAGVAPTADGGFLIADTDNGRVRRVSPAGTIITVAGTGTFSGVTGDGGPATAAELDSPADVASTADGGFLIADEGGNRVRRISPAGTITTVAGTGDTGFSGDGGPATAATLEAPTGVAPTADGGLLIADRDNNRVRRVSRTGTITTVAGGERNGFSGDCGRATAAGLSFPTGVTATGDGGFLIADAIDHRIRRVSRAGIVTTVAGTGTGGFSGDRGAATAARLRGPTAVATTPDGGFFIADRDNNRIRRVSPAEAPGRPSASLRAAKRVGVVALYSVSVCPDRDVTATARLSASSRVACELGLSRGTVAARTRKLRDGGAYALELRLSTAIRRALRRRPSTTLTLTVTLTDGQDDTRRYRRTVTVRR